MIRTVNTKTDYLVMRTVAQTRLQGNALVIGTIDQHTSVRLTDHTDQRIISNDDYDSKTDQSDQSEHTVGDDKYQILAAE